MVLASGVQLQHDNSDNTGQAVAVIRQRTHDVTTPWEF